MFRVYVVFAVIWWAITVAHNLYAHFVPTWALYHPDMWFLMVLACPLLAWEFTFKAIDLRKEERDSAQGRDRRTR